MKKILGILIAGLICFGAPKAEADSINKSVSDSGINKSAISISVKEVSSGKTVYELNSKQPMIPASTLKILTYSASKDTLGEDYEFATTLYKNNNNELFLELGADPYFTTADLKSIIGEINNKSKTTPKTFYIDDTIIDANEWGEGWQWDDDLNLLMPKYSAYNIDKNLLEIIVEPTTMGAPANITMKKFYPTTFVNLVKTGERNGVRFSRQNHISPDIITAEGTVGRQFSAFIPVNNPKKYFMFRMEDQIREAKIDYYSGYKSIKLPQKNLSCIAQITNPLSKAEYDILKLSNNFVSETVFKIAGGQYAGETGSQENSVKMLEDYCAKKGLKTDDIKVVDASGVSKNNIMTSDFMAEFLVKQGCDECFENFKNSLATPGEGTLTDRMLFFKDNLKAKTGTLSNVSSITGYITSQNGKLYAFNIMINDPKSKSNDKKTLEGSILKSIYTSF